MARYGIAKMAMAVIIVAALGGGGAGYLYLQSSPLQNPGPAASANSIASVGNAATTSTHTGSVLTGSATAPVDASKYLGYIPPGYNLAPHQVNAPVFPCPPDMNAKDCKLFQQTCGNGVCDPNERCDTCPIDCAPTGNLVCDPYTGRGGSPSSVCQAYVNGQNFG